MRQAQVREAKLILLNLKKELGKAKYELINDADRREYDQFATKFNSLADDFEVFEAGVNRHINQSALMTSPVRRISLSGATNATTPIATQIFASFSNSTDIMSSAFFERRVKTENFLASLNKDI